MLIKNKALFEAYEAVELAYEDRVNKPTEEFMLLEARLHVIEEIMANLEELVEMTPRVASSTLERNIENSYLQAKTEYVRLYKEVWGKDISAKMDIK